jgi:hypothetical protein
MKYFFWFLLVLVGLFVAKVLFFPVHVGNQIVNTAYDTVSKTINADNAIYNYEWFKQTFEDINAAKVQLENADKAVSIFKEEAGVRTSWTFDDKQEAARLSSVALGLRNHLETLIADYNARAKMANRSMFQDGILPNYIEAVTFLIKK